ncbi:MarR family winged helix-turn-helix transcriptional regulator [Lentibacter sp. XHP0401]|jgi:DNA-binding MarR family transcriptional regulator|uniref:MarR family winged helix-turn-helix transcriptional regulator n=1 Tax=Lentibacter sp. XHP0401 TaxID=2984334 RepID=UPI0021E7C6C7|nr:MarR family winged helix-turn-helix transcriptional regulator [Lentibacter sp. XHP0401]MCV2893208.1 MarR family winged helix-turn-helix transcriptional regulator [Lentibacter sp. XHP0401]
MQARKAEQADVEQIHPPIEAVTDALSFRIARFNLLNERLGGANFQNRLGVTLNEWRVIGLTEALSPAVVSDVRKMLLMDKGQLSRVVSGLVGRGFLTTHPSQEDRRVVTLSLTRAGRELHGRVLAEAAMRNESVVGCFTPDECAEFLRLLDKLTAHSIERAKAEGVTL